MLAARSLPVEAAWWLRLAGPVGLVAYLSDESPESERQFYAAVGFGVLTRTRRDWARHDLS